MAISSTWSGECPWVSRYARRRAVIASLNLAGLVFATMFAAAAAVACNWLLLRVTFHLMRSAAVRKNPDSVAAKRPTARTESVRATPELARGFARNRGSRWNRGVAVVSDRTNTPE